MACTPSFFFFSFEHKYYSLEKKKVWCRFGQKYFFYNMKGGAGGEASAPLVVRPVRPQNTNATVGSTLVCTTHALHRIATTIIKLFQTLC